MKRLILVFMLLFAGLVMGQTIIPSNGPPAGSCSTTVITNDYTTGNLWGCKQGTGTTQWVNNAASSGGAPTTSKYILQTADGSLPNAQALSALSTGLLKVTTTTGVLTNAASADIVGLFSTCSGTQYLGADGSCHTAAGTPGGSSTQLQYNNTTFGGTANWAFTSATGVIAGTQAADGNDTLTLQRASSSHNGQLIKALDETGLVTLFQLKASGNIVMAAGGNFSTSDTNSPGFTGGTSFLKINPQIAMDEFAITNGGSTTNWHLGVDSTSHQLKCVNSSGTSCLASGSGTVSANTTSNAHALAVYHAASSSTQVDPDTVAYTDGAGNLTVASVSTTGSSPDTFTPIADGTTANSFWLSSTTAGRFKGYTQSTLQTFAYQSDGLNVFASGALANGTSATSQAAFSNDTKVATDGYVDSQLTLTGSGMTAMHAYYISGASTLSEAGGGISATAPAVCVAVSATLCVTHGLITTTGLTSGAVYYVPASAGIVTSTAPSSTGQFVQRMGVAYSTTVFFVNPSIDVGTIQ